MEEKYLNKDFPQFLNPKYNLDFFEKTIQNRMKELGVDKDPKYIQRVKEEYNVIVGADLENYFLIIWSILHWCHKNGYLTGLARGSAAGSMIMYLLQITGINPHDYDLLFSRFLNAGRVAQVYLSFEFEDGFEKECSDYTDISRLSIPKGENKIAAKFFKGDSINGHIVKNILKEFKGHISLPDVDLDLEDRDAVKRFIIKHYGVEQFSTLGSYNNYKIKAAIKDLNRIVGSSFNYAALNVLTSSLFFKENKDAKFEELFKAALDNSMLYNYVQENPNIINACYWLLDTPKSASVHPCGTMSIPDTESIYTEYPCLYQDEDVPMCEFTGPELDSLGYVKNDLLGLAQLAFFKNIIALIKEHEEKEINIWKAPLDDKKTYEYLSKGWNSEVFQFNSFLLINYCKILKPNSIKDLAVAVAAVRPGPMNNGLHLKYVKRKEGKEKITYHFGYEEWTKETYGMLLFQEQLINIASYLGDLNLVEGDGLRKCLTRNNYIWTEEGYKLIGDIINKKDFPTYTLDIEKRKVVKENCAEVFSQNQVKDCLRLEFNNGNYIECSKDHKLYTLEGFKEAKDITKEDILVTSIIEKEENKNPTILREDELYLICCLVTNGYLMKDSCQFTTANEEIRKKYKECVYSYLGKDTVIHEYQDKNKVWQIFVNKIQDKLSLERVKSDGKRLPEKCMNLNRNQTLQMLGYLFDLDGSIYMTKKASFNNYQLSINYTSNSYYLINQIAILIKSFGLKTYCSLDKRDLKSRNLTLKNNFNSNKFFYIILNYSQKAKALSETEDFKNLKEYFSNFEESEAIQLPDKLVSFFYSLNDHKRVEINLSNYALKHKRWNKTQLKRAIEKYYLKEFEYLVSGDIQYINLINKVEIGNKNVFEYSMENTKHPYAFINEILVSNCLGKKKYDLMMSYHDKIKPKAMEKGCSEKEFEDIWSEWIEFSKYSFNKSHAVAYAITGYVSEYLKVHYPNEFWTAAFQKANDSQDRKERFNQYFQELKDCHSPLKVVPPNINVASTKTTYEGNEIYFPLNNIKYLSDDSVNLIIENKKKQGDFYSFEEFLSRVSPNKELNKRELENLVLAGTFDKIEGIQHPIERKRLIQILYKFLKKDYNREFFKDNFQEDELWWDLKQLDLIGIDDIDFNRVGNRFFDKYMFFTKYPSLKEKQNVTFGGVISDYVERKSKKGQYFGIVTTICNNIPYTLCLWPEEWSKFKDDIIKYKGQIICCECEVSKNKQNDTLQFSLIKGSNPKFLGSTEETKRELPKAISFKKGDIVKTDSGIIGKIVRNASNLDIHIITKEGKEFKITKWDITELVK